MCFYADYDWTPAVYEEGIATLDKPRKCGECRRVFAKGESLVRRYGQEYESCQVCEGGDCGCDSPRGRFNSCTECKCESPEYGETYEEWCCEDCRDFLKAVSAAERAAGCGVDEATPPLGLMVEYIRDGGAHDARKYFQRAAADYPALKRSRYLGWLWGRMFGAKRHRTEAGDV